MKNFTIRHLFSTRARRAGAASLAGGALLLAALGPVRAADDAAPALLTFKWATGQKQLTRITMVQDQEISGAGMPAPMKQQTIQLQDVRMEVAREVAGGAKEVEVSYARMLTESKMGEMTMMRFDSSSKETEDAGNPMAPMLRAISKAKFKLTVDPKGAVTKVEGVKELSDSVSSQVPEMMRGMLDGMLNEDSIKQLAGTDAHLPDKPVKVNDTWPVRQEMSIGPLGKLVISLTMKLKGWEQREGKRCALLEHTGTLAAANEGGTNLITVLSLKGDTTGRSWFDAEAGVLRESVTVQKMDLKMQAMGQELSSSLTQTITNKLVEFTVGK